MPPAGLKAQLIGQARLPVVQTGSQTQPATLAPVGWLRRWWPLLAPAAVSVACALSLTMQQMEIRDIKQAIQSLAGDSAAKASAGSTPTVQTNAAAPAAEVEARTQQEIARLKELASQLAVEVAQLEQLRAENAKLRTQLEATPAGYLTPEETDALAKAKAKAQSIACINNLKQLGLSVRTWAIDNGDVSPPDLLSMTNEMSTPKILFCPADTGRQAATGGWASYTSSNCSYEYLAPSAPDSEPFRVLFRCPIHGHVCLNDGSVQGEVAKRHPEQLVQRDGKLYLDQSAPPPQDAAEQPSGHKQPGDDKP
jgi:hypothetical protein